MALRRLEYKYCSFFSLCHPGLLSLLLGGLQVLLDGHPLLRHLPDPDSPQQAPPEELLLQEDRLLLRHRVRDSVGDDGGHRRHRHLAAVRDPAQHREPAVLSHRQSSAGVSLTMVQCSIVTLKQFNAANLRAAL